MLIKTLPCNNHIFYFKFSIPISIHPNAKPFLRLNLDVTICSFKYLYSLGGT